MASVKVERVYKRFGATEVVKNVSLDIEDGDFVVLVGPSGCGKSTTLRMIAGLESISDGRLLIGDTVVNDLSPRDRDVAMVFQSYALYPHMTVGENMSFGLKLRKMPKAEITKRVNEAAEILGLTELLDRKPKQMSGGQRQRVAMGRAIVRQPAVFLFDEPLSNLDAKLRVQMRAEIAKLHRRLGTTTIYVTHDQVEAMTLAKHIVVMNGGVVMQVGAPLELYQRPANTFVGGFIGSPSMNFFDVGIKVVDGARRIEGEGVSLPLPPGLAELVPDDRDDLSVGLRPEHLAQQTDATRDQRIGLDIDVLEPLGKEVYALGHVAGVPATARLDPDTDAKVGDTVPLAAELEMVHLFDRTSGMNVADLGRR